MKDKDFLTQDNARLHAFVEGYVQGVGYRFFCMQNAYVFGLSGWVRNLNNGEVEVLAEGERGNLEKYLEALHQGPSMAQVRNIRVEWHEWRGEFNGFNPMPNA